MRKPALSISPVPHGTALRPRELQIRMCFVSEREASTRSGLKREVRQRVTHAGEDNQCPSGAQMGLKISSTGAQDAWTCSTGMSSIGSFGDGPCCRRQAQTGSS